MMVFVGFGDDLVSRIVKDVCAEFQGENYIQAEAAKRLRMWQRRSRKGEERGSSQFVTTQTSTQRRHFFTTLTKWYVLLTLCV